MSEILPIYFKKSFIYSALSGIIEDPPFEFEGFAIGKIIYNEHGKCLCLEKGQPYRSSKNRKNQTKQKYGAFERIVNTQKLLKEYFNDKEDMVATFHSHGYGDNFTLSDDDKKVIKVDAKIIRKKFDLYYERWPEILMNVKIIRSPIEKKAKIRRLKNGMYSFKIPYIDEERQFNVYMNGFWVDIENNEDDINAEIIFIR